MQTEILYKSSYAVASVTLEAGEQVKAEAGAMVAMSGGISIETQATGGIMKSLSRAVLGGESFFQNTFTSAGNGETIFLAPSLPGDVFVLDLNGDMTVQSGSYLASGTGITVDSKWGGSKSFFGGEGLIMLRCSGQGQLILSSYGAIHKVEVQAGQKFRIDTGHIVAFSSGLTYNVTKSGGWKSTIFGGEGLLCEFSGQGDVYLQTRSVEAFLGWLIPKIPQRTSSSTT